MYGVGFSQIDVKLGQIAKNLAAAREGLRQLAPAGPGIVLLPELWSTGFAYELLPELAAQTPAVLKEVSKLSAEYGVLLAGSMAEQGPEKRTIFNTLFISGPEGVIGLYRKQRLFAPMAEDQYFQPGDRPGPLPTPLGTFGALVCFDLRFPELARFQVAHGAELILVAAQWPAIRVEHWQTLLTARAIENQVFVVACNRSGQTGQEIFAGHSMVIGPTGAILAHAADREAHAFVSIDPQEIIATRARFNTVAAV